jgi:hypothetical protein
MSDYTEFAPFFGILKKVADEANGIRTEYVSVTGKTDSLVKAAFEDDSNEEVKKYKAYAEKIDAQIASLKEKKDEAKATIVKAIVGDVKSASADEVKAMREKFLAKRKTFNNTKGNILDLLDGDEVALKAGLEAFEIVDLPNLGGGQSASSTGDIVRKRLSAGSYNGTDAADNSGKVTFTTLAEKSGLEPSVIREAAASAANVGNVRDIPSGTTVDFTVTVDGTNHEFSVTAK